MASSIKIEAGGVAIEFTGSEEFIEKRLPTLITEIGQRISQMSLPSRAGGEQSSDGSEATIGLGELIKSHSIDTQIGRFLAAAAWLQHQQSDNLTSTEVANALKKAKQTEVKNPSDCVNQNLKKGFIEKNDDKTFFVTPAGMQELGFG